MLSVIEFVELYVESCCELIIVLIRTVELQNFFFVRDCNH